MKKRYAFVLMGQHYNPKEHRCDFDMPTGTTSLRTVRSMDEAKQTVLELQQAGYGAIELCGAFGRDAANEFTALTGGTIAIGYVVHEPELDPLFAAFFG